MSVLLGSFNKRIPLFVHDLNIQRCMYSCSLSQHMHVRSHVDCGERVSRVRANDLNVDFART